MNTAATILSTLHAFVSKVGAGIIPFLTDNGADTERLGDAPRVTQMSVMEPDHTPRLGPSRDTTLSHRPTLLPAELRASSG